MPTYYVINRNDVIVHKFDAVDNAAAAARLDQHVTTDMAEYRLARELGARKAQVVPQVSVVDA